MRRFLTWVVMAAAAVTPASAATRAAVTIYSHDLAFIREQRTLARGAAGDTVRIGDIPDRIDVSSVRLALPGKAKVSRLAYRFDVASAGTEPSCGAGVVSRWEDAGAAGRSRPCSAGETQNRQTPTRIGRGRGPAAGERKL